MVQENLVISPGVKEVEISQGMVQEGLGISPGVKEL